MKSENKTCQNCKNQFTIEPEDFAFYERIKVPPPTFCPECRRQRRFSWRNEWFLYKRKCDLCGKNIIAMYPESAKFPVFCHDCWYSDKWEASSYGRNYDFSRPFFNQIEELFDTVPHLALFQVNSINSEFTNMVRDCKNVYLSCSVVERSENVFYSKFVDKSFNIIDSFSVDGSDTCYENMDVERNFSSSFAYLSRDCIDCRFVFDCVNCKNCVLSSNLRNKQYFIRNKPFSKEEYFKELEKMDFGSRERTDSYLEEFEKIRKDSICKFADINRASESTGDHIWNAKNAKNCFRVHDVEDIKYSFRTLINSKNIYDHDYGGLGSEMVYEYLTGGKNGSRLKFAIATENSHDSEYLNYCSNASNCFGCMGLKNKEFCILNKQYSKEDYLVLRDKIIEHMNSAPYVDKANRVHAYGEFFPTEISQFAYNETLAFEDFPISKEQALRQSWKWRDTEERSYKATISADQIPDSIEDVPDSILEETLGCLHENNCGYPCTRAFRIVPDELRFYKKMSIPLPRLCPNCRYEMRMKNKTPLKLWERQCMCERPAHGHSNRCSNEFQTPYAPDRPEIVYCEQCYQAEVA